MKNYKDSDFALNKINKDAIVYRFADGIVEITLADYLAENPDKTKADFDELKALSDADYLERDREDYRQTYKNVSLHGLDETDICTVQSPENEITEQSDKAAKQQYRRELANQALDKLTDVQRRRYIQHHVKGLSSWKIAEIEGVDHKAVLRSIWAAEKKIKKVLSNS